MEEKRKIEVEIKYEPETDYYYAYTDTDKEPVKTEEGGIVTKSIVGGGDTEADAIENLKQAIKRGALKGPTKKFVTIEV